MDEPAAEHGVRPTVLDKWQKPFWMARPTSSSVVERNRLRSTKTNQVWYFDITYIPKRRGSLDLVAIMDWHTRKVLAWRSSNTLEADL